MPRRRLFLVGYVSEDGEVAFVGFNAVSSESLAISAVRIAEPCF